MKICTWNVNGIRAACKNGFLEWLGRGDHDLICLQEIKAEESQFPEALLNWGYHGIHSSTRKRGYSGVAIFGRNKPDDIIVGLGDEEIDSEGRVLDFVYGNLHVISSYFPNSQRDHARLDYKLRFCELMHAHLTSLVEAGEHVVLCGDYNIAHTEMDLKNPKSNQKNAGFLPEERAWMSHFLDAGFVDVFRHHHPDKIEEYTWWSYRPGVRERNVGWRLDYFCCDAGLAAKTKKIQHLQSVMGSDHCPVELELDW